MIFHTVLEALVGFAFGLLIVALSYETDVLNYAIGTILKLPLQLIKLIWAQND